VPREDLAQYATVFGEHVRVSLAELVQQARRAHYVRKKEGDGAAREFPHVQMIARRRRPAKSRSRLGAEFGIKGAVWPRWGCPDRDAADAAVTEPGSF